MKSGMIIRLIDVVMLLLFGFIIVSDIVQRTQVPLPAKAKKKTVQKDTTEVIFSVIGVEIVPTRKIDMSNLQAITAQLEELGKKWQKQEDKKNQKQLSEEFCKYIVTTGAIIRKGSLIEDNAVTRPIYTLADLERSIKRAYRAGLDEGHKVMLVIAPYPNSMVQGTVNVFDICHRYGIPYQFKNVEGEYKGD